jgi:uncharacterized protein YbjT (DUF2867 family)
MKIVVIGGSGLIGTKVVSRLRNAGHEVIAASPKSGVNAVTGEGLAQALAGAHTVVDVANSPSFADEPVMEFFTSSGRNLAAAEKAAGVAHHVALSVVGTERLQASGYFRAKLVQETMIKEAGIPYTIVRATQFFEFVGEIARTGTVGDKVHMSPALFQPMAAEDVAEAVADATLAAPVNGMIEVAGPARMPLDETVRQFLTATRDPREVVSDIHAGYYGIDVNDRSLTPDAGAHLGATRFEDWLSEYVRQK